MDETKKDNSKAILTTLLILVVLLAGAGVFFLYKKNSDLQTQIIKMKTAAPTDVIVQKEKQIEELQKKEKSVADALNQQRSENEQIKKDLESLKSKISVQDTKCGLVISMVDKVLFDLAQFEIKPQSKTLLKQVADVLKNHPDRFISVEGHTDNLAVHSPRYKTNWELSALRACNVARHLIDSGISRTGVSAVAWGETKPVADNNSLEGRQRNRRVEIILYPKEYKRELEPVATDDNAQ